MYAIFRYTLLTARRDYVMIGVMLGLLAALGVAIFLGGTSLSEENEMTLTYFASASRVIIVLGLILFVSFFIRRSFENKEIEFILSRAIARSECLLGFGLGVGALAAILCLPVTIAIYLMACHVYHLVNGFSVVCWSLSLVAECWIAACFTLAASLILRSAVSASLLGIAFYLIGRMMGFFVGIFQYFTQLVDLSFLPKWVMEHLLILISTVLPRLDMFGKSAWLIYGVTEPHAILLFTVQSLVYIPLLLWMAMLDFNRKEF